jgi:hypothetical protein
MVSELWTPQEVVDHTVSSVGSNAETGDSVEQHIFWVSDPVTGKKHKFCILTDDETSQAHLEDMGANAIDRWLSEVRQKDHKPAPTIEQRKEIGKILDEIRIHRLKRKESSNGQIYYSGLEGAQNGDHRHSNK